MVFVPSEVPASDPRFVTFTSKPGMFSEKGSLQCRSVMNLH